MRALDRFDSPAGECGERFLRSAEAAVHQLVLAQHHGELGASSHQAKFDVGVGYACSIDMFPWNHGMLLRGFGPPSQYLRMQRSAAITTTLIRYDSNDATPFPCCHL